MTGAGAAAGPARPGRTARPRLLGELRAEILKIARQRLTWLMLALALLLFAFVALALGSSLDPAVIRSQPRTFLRNQLDVWQNVFQTGSGILLLIVGARLMGMEFSSGTIRVLLGRGQGRARLYTAKAGAVILLGILVLAGFAVLAGAFVLLLAYRAGPHLSVLTSLPAGDWANLGVAVRVELISIATVTLLALAAAVVGRSLAFALAVALAFFPADNFLTGICALMTQLTHNTAWAKVTTYLLGPNLNVLQHVLEPGHGARSAFAVPLQAVTAGHALAVVAAWCAFFLSLSLGLLLRKDVLE